SSMVNGNKVYQGSSRGTVFDITDPAQIKFLTKAGPSGYAQEGDGFVTVQDGYMHVGASSHYLKIDARDPSARSRVVGWDNLEDKDRDLDFASVIGPLSSSAMPMAWVHSLCRTRPSPTAKARRSTWLCLKPTPATRHSLRVSV